MEFDASPPNKVHLQGILTRRRRRLWALEQVFGWLKEKAFGAGKSPAPLPPLGRILLGPWLRRCEPKGVTILMVTAQPILLRGSIYPLSGASLPPPRSAIGRGEVSSFQLGKKCHLSLLTIKPEGDAYPTNQLLGYNCTLHAKGPDGGLDTTGVSLEDLGLLDAEGGLIYPGTPLPAFVLQGPGEELRALHGSCRKPHGSGPDALPWADDLLRGMANPQRERPHALFLTGDQIYADDVASPLMTPLTSLGAALFQWEESLPGLDQSLRSLPVDGRQALASSLGFTSGHGANHLLGFCELIAMYLMAFNHENWPDQLPPYRGKVDIAEVGATVIKGEGPEAPKPARPIEKAPVSLDPEATFTASHKDAGIFTYGRQLEALEAFREGLPKVRRLLANVPTYTIFDDHEVTDDWNLTANWSETIAQSPGGRRAMANALCAYWFIQGLGNRGQAPSREERDVLDVYLKSQGRQGGPAFESLLMGLTHGYTAPTEPPAIILDTRSSRSYDSPSGPPRLLGDAALRDLEVQLSRKGGSPQSGVILISAAPVFGVETMERLQDVGAKLAGAEAIDLEAWGSNPGGLVQLLDVLLDHAQGVVTVLSGDVHYAFSLEGRYTRGSRHLRLRQITSSALKNSSNLAQGFLEGIINRVQASEYTLYGWDTPPTPLIEDKAPHKASPKEPSLEKGQDGREDDGEGNRTPVEGPILLKRGDGEPTSRDPDFTLEFRLHYPEGASRFALIANNNLGHLIIGPQGRSALQTHIFGDYGMGVSSITVEMGPRSQA